jgi:monoamine oxidase
MSDEHLLSVVANNNPPQKAPAEDGTTKSIPGILGCFIETAKVRDNIDVPEEELKKMVKNAIEKIFKPSLPNMPEPLAVYVTNWCNEEWSGGCYSSPLAPGVWTGYKNAIREPVKNIFWAGTETSPRWNSYMEGAIRSGERAAEEANISLIKN